MTHRAFSVGADHQPSLGGRIIRTLNRDRLNRIRHPRKAPVRRKIRTADGRTARVQRVLGQGIGCRTNINSLSRNPAAGHQQSSSSNKRNNRLHGEMGNDLSVGNCRRTSRRIVKAHA